MAVRTLGAFIALAGLALALGGCAAPADSPPPATGSTPPASGSVDAAALVQTRCTLCHNLERVDAARHDRAAWQASVERMREKGAKLTDAEAETVIDYLTTREAPTP